MNAGIRRVCFALSVSALFLSGLAVLHPVALAAQEGQKTLTAPKKVAKTSPLDTIPTWTVLENRLTLRQPFNADEGKVRVIAFLSPSCPKCLKNAGQIQSRFLEQNEADNLSLFIVWVKALSTDSEEALPPAISHIPDPRVRHFWDEKRALNAQLLDAVMFDIHMRIYDVFLLYDGLAKWEKRLPRPGYFLHEVKGMPGPGWNFEDFKREVEAGLAGKPFSDLFD